MKKILPFVVVFAMTVLVVFCTPINFFLKKEKGDLPFNLYCPSYLMFSSSADLVDSFWTGDYETGIRGKILACKFRILMDRDPGHAREMKKISTVFLIGLRPDLQAYFYDKLIRRGQGILYRVQLADLYAEGKGVPENASKARALYREDLIEGFHYDDADECSKSYEEELERYETKVGKEQVRWAQSLCSKSPDELYAIAKEYASRDNPDRSVVIADQIALYLLAHTKSPHSKEFFLNLHEEIKLVCFRRA